MKFTTYSDAYLKSLKKDELIDLYRQLEDNLKSEIAENETTMNYIRATNIKITQQHKKDIIKAKKEAVEEFVDTLIYKLDYLKPIKVNLGFDKGIDVVIGIAEQTGHEYGQQGPQPFPSVPHGVLGDGHDGDGEFGGRLGQRRVDAGVFLFDKGTECDHGQMRIKLVAEDAVPSRIRST